MRTETTTRTLYQFDELSDQAKERARDWYREGMQSPEDYNADTVLEDAVRMGELLGITIGTRPVPLMNGTTRQEPDIFWDASGCRNDHVAFSGRYSYEKGSVARLAKEAPTSWPAVGERPAGESKRNAELNRIARELAEAQRQCFYRASATITARRRGGLDVEVWDVPDNRQDLVGAIQEAIRDFAGWILDCLRDEIEYQTSDETVDENIRINEYEFAEDGHRA